MNKLLERFDISIIECELQYRRTPEDDEDYVLEVTDAEYDEWWDHVGQHSNCIRLRAVRHNPGGPSQMAVESPHFMRDDQEAGISALRSAMDHMSRSIERTLTP